MNINSLPNDVLHHIFSRLPLLDQVHLHRVCPCWKSLQPTVTSTRKCLTLLIGKRTDPPASSLITESSLTIPHLDQIDLDSQKDNPQESTLEFRKLHDNLATHLVSLFPNINSLCLALNETEHEDVDQVILLLCSWSKSLKSLSFYCCFDKETIDCIKRSNVNFSRWSRQLLKLICFINQHCLALESLTFDVREWLYDWTKQYMPNLDLPCLARLKEFKFCSRDNVAILFKSLKKYGVSDGLRSISFHKLYAAGVDAKIVPEFAQHPIIAAKFVALPQCWIPRKRTFFNTFTSLTTLKFVQSNQLNALSKFTAYLAPLHSLLYLHLTIDDIVLSEYDAIPSYEFHSLPSVKILSLELLGGSHPELASRHWPTIFPSIQYVEICTISARCEVCSSIDELRLRNFHGFKPSNDPIILAKKKQCLKMLLAPLAQCRKLKKIVTNRTDDADRKEWTIEELTN